MLASKGAAVVFQSQVRLRDLIAPMLLTVAAILLTSLLINKAHGHLTALHIWHNPEDLTLAYVLPTIFITALYGSNFGVSSALVGGLGAAYFVYPPQFSFVIDSTQHLVELGFLMVLSVTACKSTAIITDAKPLNRGSRRAEQPRAGAVTRQQSCKNSLAELRNGRALLTCMRRVGTAAAYRSRKITSSTSNLLPVG